MKNYCNRFGGYILLSMSLALILGPFKGNPFMDFSFSRANIFRYVIAVLFIPGGITLMRNTNKAVPGIPLNPRWSQFIGDCIIIVFLSMLAYGLCSYGLNKITTITPYLYDPIAMGLMAITYLPVTALLAAFSCQFGQSIEINKNEILIHSAGETQRSHWSEILGFELKNTYVIAGNTAFSAPRKMQTKLVIHTRKKKIELIEPGTKKTKKRLIRELTKNAPDHLKTNIVQLSDTW